MSPEELWVETPGAEFRPRICLSSAVWPCAAPTPPWASMRGEEAPRGWPSSLQLLNCLILIPDGGQHPVCTQEGGAVLVGDGVGQFSWGRNPRNEQRL